MLLLLLCSQSTEGEEKGKNGHKQPQRKVRTSHCLIKTALHITPFSPPSLCCSYSLTISNPIAMVSRSKNLDERIPARYRSTIHDSLDYSTDVDIQDSDFNFLTNDHEYRESAIDDLEMAYISHQPSQVAHTTQPSQMTQLSTATDIFRERSLPKLSPLSYSSQMLTAPPLSNHYHSLSVDETDTRTALGSRRQSLMALIPNPSPSLRVPTLMARSLKNEETKSAQGSKGSVQGSRTSIQGSRASILGSRGSVHTGTGSRSQIYSSNLSSREHSRLGLGVSEEDEVSLPLSGRGISPAMKQSSFEEVPTRDSPRPEIASHTVGFGRKDFASLTCIPNRYAVEVDKFEEKQQLSTVPEKQTVEDVQENEETKKKPRSRAMSKLEKLTSLDYIRASLRLKKKRVSFVRTPELSKKDKQKNTKEKQDQEKKVKGQQQPPSTSTSRPGKELHHSRRHSASGRAEFSPQHLHGEQSLSSHNYPDHFYYPQLSQPVYYGAAGAGAGGTGGVHPAAAAAIFYQYPQLSQQYYAQLSQGGPGPGPYPPHMMYHSMMDSYSRGFGDPTSPARYQQIVTPDLFDDDTPEPEFYQERNLDNVLQQRQEANGFGDSLRSPEHTGPRVTSPDRFTETSETSFYSMHPPHQSSTDAESHSHEDSLTSAHKHFMEEFAMDGVEQYSYGGPPVDGHHYVPTYPGDMLNRTTLIPHEAYRDVYSHGGETYNTHEQINGHYYSHYTSPTAYSAVSQSKVGRRPSRSSYASSTSDHTHLDSVHEAGSGGEGEATKNGDMNGSSQKNRVSWSAEVIEYQRTPSDLADSDFDFSQF